MGEFTERDWQSLVNRHEGKCFYCKERPGETVDHVVPLSRGGTNTIGNILPACRQCNSGKHAKFISELKLKNKLKGQVPA